MHLGNFMFLAVPRLHPLPMCCPFLRCAATHVFHRLCSAPPVGEQRDALFLSLVPTTDERQSHACMRFFAAVRALAAFSSLVIFS